MISIKNGYRLVWKCTACNRWYGEGIYPYVVCPKCGARHLKTNEDGKLQYINKNIKLITAKKRFFKYVELEGYKE